MLSDNTELKKKLEEEIRMNKKLQELLRNKEANAEMSKLKKASTRVDSDKGKVKFDFSVLILLAFLGLFVGSKLAKIIS